MRKKVLLILAVFIFGFNIAYATPSNPIKRVVFFGDSLSDNGNLYNGNVEWWLPIPRGMMPKPPYFEGRFSNGKVWADRLEELAAKEGLDIKFANYAVGGLVVHKTLGASLPYSLGDTIDRFFKVDPREVPMQDTLFVIWIGGNDLFKNYLDRGAMARDLEDDIFGKLVANGARHFLVLNLPDLGKSFQTTDPAERSELHHRVEDYNEYLKTLVTRLETEYSADVKLYDSYAMMNEMLQNPDTFNKKYGSDIRYFNEPCWRGGYTGFNMMANAVNTSVTGNEENLISLKKDLDANRNELNIGNADTQPLAEILSSSPDLAEAYSVSKMHTAGMVLQCQDPEHYVFWDKVHPTAAVHEVIAKLVHADMKGRWL